MLLDKELIFSDQQAITASAASTEEVDMKLANMGDGNPLSLYVEVNEDFADGTSLTVKLQHSDTSGSGFADILVGPVVLTADLVKGKKVYLGKVPEVTKRYLQIQYTVSGTYTAGKITSAIKLGAV